MFINSAWIILHSYTLYCLMLCDGELKDHAFYCLNSVKNIKFKGQGHSGTKATLWTLCSVHPTSDFDQTLCMVHDNVWSHGQWSRSPVTILANTAPYVMTLFGQRLNWVEQFGDDRAHNGCDEWWLTVGWIWSPAGWVVRPDSRCGLVESQAVFQPKERFCCVSTFVSVNKRYL